MSDTGSSGPRPKRRTPPLVKTKTPGIYKRGDRYVVVHRDPRGKQRKRFASTMAHARDLKASLTADVRRGEQRELSRVTFAEYAATWVDTYGGRTSRGVRESTLVGYRRTMRQDAIPFFGRMRLAEIEPRDLKAYAQRVASRGVSGNTVRLAIAPVRALLATAVEDGLIRSNPAARLRLAHTVQAPAEDVERVKALTEDELRTVLAAVSDEWRLLISFVAQTGLRISEALALRWGDVDFGRRRVAIRRRLYDGAIAPPKTRYGRRDVPLTTGMARSLWTARGTACDDGLIFADRNGGYLDRTSAFRAVRAAGKRAGVPWVGLHTLRHTCATLLFRGGYNAKQVQMWLGHHSPAFTLATYVHLLPDDLPAAAFFDQLAPEADAVNAPQALPLRAAR